MRFAHGLPALLAQSAMESRGHCCNDIAGEFCPLNLCCICARKRYGSVKVKVKASLKEIDPSEASPSKASNQWFDFVLGGLNEIDKFKPGPARAPNQ